MSSQFIRHLRIILRDLPRAAAEDVDPLSFAQIYAPREHVAVLDPDRTLVVGNRGAGKTFWARALTDDDLRDKLAELPQFARIRLNEVVAVYGFKGEISDEFTPSRDLVARLSDVGIDPEHIWQAVVEHAYLRKFTRLTRKLEIGATARAFAADVEAAEKRIRFIDARIHETGKRLLLVFDKLDAIGRTWPDIRHRVSSILDFARRCRALKAIRVKVFMRHDQALSREIWSGADLSKIYNERARLTWPPRALYDLLFLHLNKPRSIRSRLGTPLAQITGMEWEPQSWTEEEQEQALAALAGTGFMETGPIRARLYTWIINQLSDAKGDVMPRAFLELMREAVLDEDDPSDEVFTPASLKAACTPASERNLAQLRDEYWWLPITLQPLMIYESSSGFDIDTGSEPPQLMVPCRPDELYTRWQRAGTVSYIQTTVFAKDQAPPPGFENKPELSLLEGSEPYLLDSLIQIAVASRLPDGSIYFPDVMRLAMGLKRKGGVRRRKARPI